jgi:hypothetical protein
MMQARILISVVVLSLLLSGCTTSWGQRACDGMVVQSAHAGSEFVYSGQGTIGFHFVSDGFSGIDWPDRFSVNNGNPSIHLPAGATVEVTISRQATYRIGMSGGTESVYEVGYTATRLDHGPFRFMEEWMESQTSSLASVMKRNANLLTDVPNNQEVFTKNNRTPLLFAPLFWDRPLSTGEVGVLNYPTFIALPSGTSSRDLTFEVLRTYENELVCHAEILIDPDVRVQVGGEPRRIVEKVVLVVSELEPVPIRYEEHYPDSSGMQNLLLKLEQSSPGDGARLLPYGPAWLAPLTKMEMSPPVGGFLADAEQVFPTGYMEALEAVEQNPDLRRWLNEHPEAAPLHVAHRMGAPEDEGIVISTIQQGHLLDRIVDRWEITWVDPAGGHLMVWVTKSIKFGIEETEEISAHSVTTTWEGGLVPVDGPWPPLQVLADLHEFHMGGRPETVSCWLAEGWCSVGTHQGTGDHYAQQGASPGGLTLQGMIFWLEKGWLLQENSYQDEGTP